MALDANAIRRLTIVATETGLTSVNTKLQAVAKSQDQVALSSTRMATATQAADQRVQALLRQRDRLATAMSGGVGGIASDAGMFALTRVGAIVAGVGTVMAAYAALNLVIGRGTELLEKYANAHRSVDRSDLISNLEKLGAFQGDRESAAQARYATELGLRLQDAKFTIDQFLKVQLDVTDAALKMQGAWVTIVENIAKAVELAGRLPDPALTGAGVISRAALSSMPGANLALLAMRGVNYMAGPAPTAPTMDESYAAARGRLGSALETSYIGRDGAPRDLKTFAGRFGDAIDQLTNAGKKATEQAKETRTTWDRALDSISKSIAMQEADAKAVGATAGAHARLRVEVQLTEAAQRAGIDITGKNAEAYERLANRAEKAADALAKARLLNDLQFERDQLGRGDIDAAIASRLRSAGLPVNLQSIEADMIRVNEQLKLGKDLATNFVSGFTRDMMNGVKATEALGNALSRLADRLIDMAVNDMVAQAFGGRGGGGLLSLLGLGGNGNLAGASSVYMQGGVPVPTFHSGGIVGSGGQPTRMVHPAYYDTAPRFHSGGEVPIMALAGEEVLTRSDPRHRANGGKATSLDVRVHVENRSGSEIKVSQQRAPSGFDFGLLIESIDGALAQRQSDGTGQHAQVLRNQYGVERKF